MKPLILVKHSLPEIVEHIPAREWRLSMEGRRRVRALADLLRPYQPEIIVTSVEPKAHETAEILAGNLKLAHHTMAGLHEHDRGDAPFYSKSEFQALVQEFFSQPDALIFGRETASQTLVRFRVAIEAILKSYEGKGIVIVAHGTVISLYASWLTGQEGYALWQKLGLPSFVVLDVQSRSLLDTVNLS